MNAPFGILFLKKVELYNLVKDQRKKVGVMKSLHPSSKNPITWPVEEKILKWTYHGHKYLTNSINKDDFDLKNSNKLKDWELIDKKTGKVYEDYKDAINQPKSILKNMVAREFARYDDENSTDEKFNHIIINKGGLLLGEVIYNVQYGNCFVRNSYRFYSILIDYIGTLILLIFVVIPTIFILVYNFINILLKLFNPNS